jgi:hypothetical protein
MMSLAKDIWPGCSLWQAAATIGGAPAVAQQPQKPTFLFLQNVLYPFMQSIRTDGMERSRATLSQLQSQRRPSPINTLREANSPVAFAADTNIDTLVI